VVLAVRGTVLAMPNVAPAAGEANVIVGAETATVTLTADDVTVPVLESVTRAVSATVPAVLGVHEIE
jgi:hypothetical protein